MFLNSTLQKTYLPHFMHRGCSQLQTLRITSLHVQSLLNQLIINLPEPALLFPNQTLSTDSWNISNSHILSKMHECQAKLSMYCKTSFPFFVSTPYDGAMCWLTDSPQLRYILLPFLFLTPLIPFSSKIGSDGTTHRRRQSPTIRCNKHSLSMSRSSNNLSSTLRSWICRTTFFNGL